MAAQQAKMGPLQPSPPSGANVASTPSGIPATQTWRDEMEDVQQYLAQVFPSAPLQGMIPPEAKTAAF